MMSADSTAEGQLCCGCFSTRHPCVANCIGCGRIYCAEEVAVVTSQSPCFFCKEVLVYSPRSKEDVERGGQANASAIRAYALKDKLLVFDKENAKRTTVRDAQADYYENDTWLSATEKAALDEKERLRRERRRPTNRKTKMTFDFAGRRVLTFTAADDEEEEGGNEDNTGAKVREEEEVDLVGFQNMKLMENKRTAGVVYRLLQDSLDKACSGSSNHNSRSGK